MRHTKFVVIGEPNEQLELIPNGDMTAVSDSCFESLMDESNKLNPYPLSLPELQLHSKGENNCLIKALMWQTRGPLSLSNDAMKIRQGIFKEYTKVYAFQDLKKSIILCGDIWKEISIICPYDGSMELSSQLGKMDSD